MKHNQKKGWIVINQIGTIDKQRVLKLLDKLSGKEIAKVKMVINKLLLIE